MAYSEVGDLLLGGMTVSLSLDKQKFVDDASDEIDSKLGFFYTLPLVGPGDTALPEHEQKLLKLINNKLASGRIILTLAVPQEQAALHAYGLRLVTEAMNDLMLIANGQVDLTAVRVNIGETVRDNAASVYNHDAESGVDMYENAVMRPGGAYWNPGEVVPSMTRGLGY